MEVLAICCSLFILSLTYSFKGKTSGCAYQNESLVEQRSKIKQVTKLWLFLFASEIIAEVLMVLLIIHQ